MPTQRYSVTQPHVETVFAWIRQGDIAIPEIQGPGCVAPEPASALHFRRDGPDDDRRLPVFSHQAAKAHGPQDPQLFQEPVKR
jgi:hypothetical protein